jgi:hypothetical protein
LSQGLGTDFGGLATLTWLYRRGLFSLPVQRVQQVTIVRFGIGIATQIYRILEVDGAVLFEKLTGGQQG